MTKQNNDQVGRGRRSRAEWVTLAVSCALLAVLVALLLTQVGADDAPPDPRATVQGPARRVDDAWMVAVSVENRGGATASNVQVVAELIVDGETTTADQTLDFLAADAVEDVVFVFDTDPARGELSIAVASFAVP